MNVSYSWLQEYIEDTLPPAQKVAEALTMHSFEIESIEKKGTDIIFDVKILPNRSHDCLSHYGIASEIASVLKLTRKPLLSKNEWSAFDSHNMSVSIDTKLCTQAVKVHIQNVKVGESPEWLKEKLQSMGQRPINSIVDITNYLMFSFGQPMHAFDAMKISEKKGKREIHIRTAKKGEKIMLLNGKEYELDPSMVVISDHEKALDVAGVMGGKETGVGMDTTEIILSMCTFDAVSIRKTAKTLGIRTDASVRFENEISPVLVSRALPYALKLISEIAGGSVVEAVELTDEAFQEKKIVTTAQKISNLLGISVSNEEIIEILGRENIVSKIKGDEIHVFVSPERLDIDSEESIAEEVGRLHGYEKIPPAYLDAQEVAEKSIYEYIQYTIRKALQELGFSEVYTYAFQEKGEVEIANPIAGDKSFLRRDLVSSLTNSLEHNFKYADLLGIKDVRIFEIGKVFTAEKEGEYMHFGIAAKHGKGKKQLEPDVEIARAITAIEETLGVSIGDISIVGGVAEINIDAFVNEVSVPDGYVPKDISAVNSVSYKPISPYPFSVRDVAFFVTGETDEKKFEEEVRNAAGEYLVRLALFDVFAKEVEGVKKTSYAYRLVFQAHGKTLVEEEINGAMEKVYEKLKVLGYEIR